MTNGISMIVQSVQVMDFTIGELFGRSCAIPEFYPNFNFGCPDPVSGSSTIFGDGVYVLPLGLIVTMLVVLPMGMVNLDDNIFVQKGAFVAILAIVFIWVGIFISQGLEPSRVPAIGSNFTTVLGVVVFNFAMITSIPSWVNEKKENVSIEKSFAVAMPLCICIFILLGFFGGMAFPPFTNGQTVLVLMYGLGNKLAKITFFLFPACVNLTSIPVFSIMQRYNLVESGICGPRLATLIAVGVPWLVCIPLYTGKGYELLVTWSGIVVTSVVNFVVPPILYIVALRKTREEAEKKAALRATTMTTNKESGLTHAKLEELGAPSANGGAAGAGAGAGDAPVKRSKSSAFANAAMKISTQHKLGRIDTTVLVEGASTAGAGDSKTPTAGGESVTTALGGGPDSATGAVGGHDTAVAVVPGAGEAPATRAQSLGRRLSLLAHSATAAAKDMIKKSRKAKKLAAAKEERQKRRDARKKMRMKEPEEAELQQPPLVLPTPWTPPKYVAAHGTGEGHEHHHHHASSKWGHRKALLQFRMEQAWWALTLPICVAMHYTIPHPASFNARSSVQSPALGVPVVSRFRLALWWLACVMSCLAWSGGLTYMLLWCAALFCEVTTFHPFLLGLYVLGVGLRIPALMTEMRGYRAGQGDLNRVFLNNVLQIVVCVPVPWLIYHIIHGAEKVHLYSGDITVLSLSLFIMGSMIVVVFRSFNWIADRKVVTPIAAIAVFFAVEAGLVDYQVLLGLTPECAPGASSL